MPVLIKNKHTSPVTLPFPFRGILPAGGSIRVDLTEAEALEALAIVPTSRGQSVFNISPAPAGVEISTEQQGNAVTGSGDIALLNLLTLLGAHSNGANVGAGVGIFRDQIGQTLNFKTLIAGTNITITPTGLDELTIASAAGVGESNLGANAGGAVELFRDKTGVTLNFKTLVAGTGVSLTPAADTVTVSATGEINSAANVGGGSGVFRDKSGVTLNLKSIKAGANVTVTPSADEIEIAAAAPGETNTASNVGAGDGVFKQKVGADFEFKSIVSGTNISISVGADDLTLSTTAEANLGANVGAGSGIFRDKTSATLNFKSLTAGSNITLTPSADEVEIAGPSPGETNLGANVGTGAGWFRDKTGSTLNYKSVKAGTNITLTPSADEILIDASGTGEANLTANVGTGDGVFRDKTGVTFNLRSLKAGSNITLTPSADEIEIAASTGGGPPDEVIVTSKSSFPAPSAGVITLADNTRYRIIGTIALGIDRIEFGINSPLLGRSVQFDGLTYTGTGNMLTVPSSALGGAIENLKLTATSGTALDVNAVADFAMHEVDIDAATLGDIDTTTSVHMVDVVAAGFGVGFSFSGTGSRLTLHNVVLLQTTGGSSNAVIDLGSATFDSIRMLTVRAISTSGGVGLTGLASGGNVNSGGTALMNDSDLDGAGTALTTITADDLQWIFSRVLGVLGSHVLGFFQQNSGTEVTAVNGPTKLTITTTAGILRRMTHTGNNTLRYDALQDRQVVAAISVLVSKVSGGDFVADIGVAVNGTIVARVIDVDFTAGQESVSFGCPLPTALTDTDVIELYADNTGGSQNINFQSATLFVKEV